MQTGIVANRADDVVPPEERPLPARRESWGELVDRLSRQSVTKRCSRVSSQRRSPSW